MFGKKNKSTVYLGKHISGLEIPDNIDCTLTLSDSGLTINVPSIKKEFTLSLDRIENISVYHEVEIEKHLKSSAAKGVIGAMAFGVTGAIIGSRPKEKNTRKVHFFLTIDYPDNQLVFHSEDGFSSGKMVDYFTKLKPQSAETKNITL